MNRLPGGQQPRQQPKSSQGPVHRVPCPHCGFMNDFRNLDSQGLLDTGHSVYCRDDDGGGCGRLMMVVAVQTIKMIAVKPVLGVAPRGPHQAQEARTLSHAQLQRLLKG